MNIVAIVLVMWNRRAYNILIKMYDCWIAIGWTSQYFLVLNLKTYERCHVVGLTRTIARFGVLTMTII